MQKKKKLSPKFKKAPIVPIDVIVFYFRYLANNDRKILFWGSFFVLISSFFWSLLTSSDRSGAVVALIFFLLNIYTVFFDFIEKKSLKIEDSKDVMALIPSLRVSGIESERGGFEVVAVEKQNDSILMSFKLNKYLRESSDSILLEINKNRIKHLIYQSKSRGEFFKDALITQYREARKNGKLFFNEDKISLSKTLYPGIKEISCFKSNYFLSFVTNELCIKNIYDYTSKEIKVSVWEGLREFPLRNLGEKDELLSLEESRLSNHMGGNTIAVTKDKLICLWFQGERAFRSEGLLAPTGSGSLDWADYKNIKNKSLKNLVEEGMRREFREESSKAGNYMLDIEKIITKVIGFYRWTGKSGLPGFFGITKIDQDSSVLYPNTTEVRSLTTFPAHSLPAFKGSLESIICRNDCSTPLFANIKCILGLIDEDPDYLDFLFN
jgi:hypothetical protein